MAPSGLRTLAQSCESGIGIHKMMENSGADNLVEGVIQLVDTIDGELMDLKIRQVVFAFEVFSASHTRRADVDTRDLSCRPPQGMLCCLRRSATCDKDGIVFPIRLCRAKKGDNRRGVFAGPRQSSADTFQGYLPARIRVAVVEVPDLLRYIQ